MIKLYKTILPIATILSLVTSTMLILSLFGRKNVLPFHSLIGPLFNNFNSEPFTLILLGIGLIGLAKISR